MWRAYALLARQAGFGSMETITFSVLVFAGASQMMAVEMYSQSAGIAAPSAKHAWAYFMGIISVTYPFRS